MKILIVSDTHRQNANYLEVLRKEKPLDMVIHCGDIEGSEELIAAACECPSVMVAGNNDFFSPLPREEEIEIGRYKVLVTHGNYYYVSSNNELIKDEARARGFDIVMYGHIHRPVVEQEEDLIVVNPGSLSYPRQEGRRPSYVIMELDENGEAHFEIRYLEKVVKSFWM